MSDFHSDFHSVELHDHGIIIDGFGPFTNIGDHLDIDAYDHEILTVHLRLPTGKIVDYRTGAATAPQAPIQTP